MQGNWRESKQAFYLQKSMITTHFAIPMGSNTCKLLPTSGLIYDPSQSKWAKALTLSINVQCYYNGGIHIEPFYHNGIQVWNVNLTYRSYWNAACSRAVGFTSRTSSFLKEDNSTESLGSQNSRSQKWRTAWHRGESLDKVHYGYIGLTGGQPTPDASSSYLLLLGCMDLQAAFFTPVLGSSYAFFQGILLPYELSVFLPEPLGCMLEVVRFIHEVALPEAEPQTKNFDSRQHPSFPHSCKYCPPIMCPDPQTGPDCSSE